VSTEEFTEHEVEEAAAAAPYGPDRRYRRLAETLLSAPDPVTAIAHELGDQHARLDGVLERLRHVEATLSQRSNAGWQGAR
jgi:hypothetical protein